MNKPKEKFAPYGSVCAIAKLMADASKEVRHVARKEGEKGRFLVCTDEFIKKNPKYIIDESFAPKEEQ